MARTATRILDSAQALAQARGYNGFSYADISAELGVSKPSIHHHFPSKARLAEALVARYRQRFDDARAPYDDPTLPVRARLEGYADLYAEVFTDGGRMCLCGVFAADAASLPAGAQQATAAFFDDQLRWVAGLFRTAGRPPARARATAQAYLAALEGALLLARAGAQIPRQPGRDGLPQQPDRPDAVVLTVSRTLLDALL